MGVVRPVLRPLAATLLGMAAVISCAPPYYPQLDAAAPLLRQMTAVGTVGPVPPPGGPAATNVRFLPTRPSATSPSGSLITSGFVVAANQSADLISFAYLDADGAAQMSSEQYPFALGGADPNYPLYEYDVTSTVGGQASVVVFRFHPANLAASTYEQLLGNPSTGQLLHPTYALFAAPLTGGIFAGYTPIGAAMSPGPPAPPDTFEFAASQGGTSITTASATVDGSTAIFPAPVGPAAVANPLPGTLLRTLYFFNAARNTHVAQFFSAGAWTCLQWTGGGTTTVMDGVDHRLDAVLSSGDFLSTEGGTLRVYDSGGTGTKVVETPLYGVQFCYEAFLGTTPYVFFTLPLSARNARWVFALYAVPTSEMRSLGS